MIYPNIRPKDRPRAGAYEYQAYHYDRFPHDDRDSYTVIKNKGHDRNSIYDRMDEEEYKTGMVSYLDTTIQPITRSHIIKRSRRMSLKSLNTIQYPNRNGYPICKETHGRKRGTVLNGQLLRFIPIMNYNMISFNNAIWYINRGTL